MNLLSCSFYVDFNIPFMLRYLGGQYMSGDRDAKTILLNIQNLVCENVYNDRKRILTEGLPTHWTVLFISNLHLSPQGLIVKSRKNDRLMNDTSFVSRPESICLNIMTRQENEPELEYGTAFISHLTRIYDMYITHPTEELLLFSDDIRETREIVQVSRFSDF